MKSSTFIMNPTVLPKFAHNKASEARKGFKHFYLLQNEDHVVRAQAQFSGFCYIGKNSENIVRLANLYRSGFTCDSPKQAIVELSRMLKQTKASFPEFIVCEAEMDVHQIRTLRNFLQSNALFRGIPFLVDVAGMADHAVNAMKQSVRPDEIIGLRGMTEQELLGKIRFLRRFKSRMAAEMAPKIEEYSPVNMDLGLMCKRTFDILVSGIALLVLSPLMLLIAVAIALESGWPIFYISKRAGRGYRIFDFYKFRTMVPDADKKLQQLAHMNQYGAECTAGPVFFKVSNDPRITKVGSFLRNTSLDELPQLLNVLKGDMSLVGNRPLPLYEAKTLTTDDYAMRFMAPAGITGLWQIKKRGTKEMSVEERISMDIDYANKCSFSTDLWIIAKTPTALLQKENV
jgi:lipopolysaccharide/colanic/teichoic acid biosynthesis glycosyltransferase